MTAAPHTTRARALDALTILLRLAVGAWFVYMGLSKALHPEYFLKLLRQYELTQTPLLLNTLAATLPWFEAFCGLLLVAGVAVRGTALILATMVIPFSAVVLHHALALAAAKHLPFCLVRFDCGCGAGEVYICNKLFENALLLLVALWLAGSSRPRACLRFSLWSPAAPASKG